MVSHPYLRAYMAGIVVPTVFLLFLLTALMVGNSLVHVGAPVERAVVFPMAVVPNLWGLWNMLYLNLHERFRYSIGVHGAFLPVLLVPAGVTLAKALDVPFVTVPLAVTILPIGVILYYLAWKYLVGTFNRVLGIA